MDEHAKSIYLSEVERQCEFACGALAQLDHSMRVLGSDATLSESHLAQAEVFRSIHSFLTHSSNISKLLWPAGSTAALRGRGQVLRQALQIGEDDHPLHCRRLRDHLEHFDERLDHWHRSSQQRNFIQDNIGPWGVIDADAGDVMRWYDPHARSVIFRGERFDLAALAASVVALLPVATDASKASWLALRNVATKG